MKKIMLFSLLSFFLVGAANAAENSKPQKKKIDCSHTITVTLSCGAQYYFCADGMTTEQILAMVEVDDSEYCG